MAMLGCCRRRWRCFFYVWPIQRAGAVFVSFTTYMSPLWATGLGVLFLNEELTGRCRRAGADPAGVAVANRAG